MYVLYCSDNQIYSCTKLYTKLNVQNKYATYVVITILYMGTSVSAALYNYYATVDAVNFSATAVW